MIFNEKTSSPGSLNSSSSLPYNDPFGIVEDIGSTIPLMSILTSLSTFVSKSTSSQSMLTETVTSLDQYFQGNGMSLTPYLPQWVVKRIEAIGANVGDISIGRQTRSHKHQASVSLIT